MRKNRIFLSPPSMTGREMDYIHEAFKSNWIAPLGTNVDCFEKELCSYIGASYGLALSSGTAGIHLALRYLGVKPGDYVFCSDLTFAGSCNPIMYQYANPVFIDSETESWNMSPEALEAAFEWARTEGKMPKAVIIVDLYGQPADFDRLLPICEKYGIPVIEDAAEALGSKYKDKHCGSFGEFAVFSFNGNKIITTSGGGMVVSENKAAIDKLRFWSTQAREQALHYEHKEFGYNYRISNVCAGIGRGQLTGLDDKIAVRRDIRNRYVEGFEDLPVGFIPVAPFGEPNYWLTVMTINEECQVKTEDIINALNAENIESRPVWKPMHLQPVFDGHKFIAHPGVEESVGGELFRKGVCLPSGDTMTPEEQERIISIIRTVFYVRMSREGYLNAV